MNEIINILKEMGVNVDTTVLLLICGIIEIIKTKLLKGKGISSVYFTTGAFLLSFGASFLILPITVYSVILNTAIYFILVTLFYDTIVKPFKELLKK